MDKSKIDFGDWRVPTKWEDLTLQQFQDIKRYYENKDDKFDVRNIITILTNKSQDEVDALPLDFYEKILSKASFLLEEPKLPEPKPSITISGQTYSVNTMNQLKTGEYVAVEQYQRADKYNFAALLGILCRKKGEIYDSHFENEVLEERIKMFEKQPFINVYPIAAFFLTLWSILQMPFLLSLEVEEELNDLTAANTEILKRNGGCLAVSTKWRIKKLKKLKKSVLGIC